MKMQPTPLEEKTTHDKASYSMLALLTAQYDFFYSVFIVLDCVVTVLYVLSTCIKC